MPSFSVSALRAAIQREEHAVDPLTWAEDCTPDHFWSVQRQIIESVRDHRRTAVPSCHASGKSFTAARVARWWIESHPPGQAFVVTSAPTGRQVRAILWREIARTHAHGSIGRLNQTEWWLDLGSHEEMVAFGQKPADVDPSAFQGIHAPYVLIIFDEACGMPQSLFDAADTLMTNPDARFLAIGNPDDPSSSFERVCRPASGWNVIRVSAFDTPCMTGEPVPEVVLRNLVSNLWIREKAADWIGRKCPSCLDDLDHLLIRHHPYPCPSCGKDVPLPSIYLAKVLALFPDTTAEGLIPLSWIRQAQERTLPPGRRWWRPRRISHLSPSWCAFSNHPRGQHPRHHARLWQST
jgi:hypothetical protein